MAAPMNRAFSNFGKICLNCSKFKYGALFNSRLSLPLAAQTRGMKKHWDPKFRKQRAQKTYKMDIPDFQKLKEEANMSPEEQRSYFKRKGLSPPRTHQERDLVLASTGSIFEEYVPPEGDGVASLISGKGAKQRLTELEKKGKSFMQMRKIRQFEEFDPVTFADKALDIYLETHQLLMDIKKNEDRLHDLVSEKAYPDMVHHLEKRTVRWEYVEALEPPRVVHIRTVDMLSKENLYGQVTVRLHSKQTLALYDRFGRLAYGSEELIKDVLEYVVFEKHLSDDNSRWRIHGKVVPDWMPPRQPVLRTLRMPNFRETEEEDGEGEEKEAAAAS